MKKTLVIGASENPERYSYKATSLLKDYKHEVVPFGPRKGSIQQIPIVTEFPTSTDFDTVTLYLNPTNQAGYIDKILDLKPKRVVFNPGTENPAFEEQLRANGIEALEACTLVLLHTNQY